MGVIFSGEDGMKHCKECDSPELSPGEINPYGYCFGCADGDLAAAQSRADGYALLVGEYGAALENVRACVHVQEHGGYVAGATPADQCDRWVCGVVNRALAADPEVRAAELLAAAQGMERAIQAWLDDPNVDATQEETDLLGEAYGYWVNAVAGTSGPARIEPAP